MTYRELRREFRKAQRRYGSALGSVADKYAEMVQAQGLGDPLPGSPAEEQRAYLHDAFAETYEEPYVWVAGQSLLRLAVAGDHLESIAVLFRSSEAGTYGISICARGLFEMCGITAWLLEPAVSPEERLQRSMNDRLVSLRGSLRFIEKGGVEAEFIKADPSDRIAEVAGAAERMGFPLQGKGDRVSVEPGRPGFTDLVDGLVIPGAYSFFSAYSHGETWAFVHSATPTTEVGAGTAYVHPQVTLLEYRAIAWRILKTFTATVERAGHYFGWDLAGYRQVNERAKAAIEKGLPNI